MLNLLAENFSLTDSTHAQLPDRITHLVLHRSKVPYLFLHEPALIRFKDRFFAAWNACGQTESDRETVIQWTTWDDDFTKNSGIRVIRPALRIDDTTNWESCQFFEYQGFLYAWLGQVHCQPHASENNGGRSVLFRFEERTEEWVELTTVEGFQPLNPPVTLADGRLLCGGEFNLHEPRVMIQESDDLTKWKVIALPHDASVSPSFPETALLRVKGGVRAFVRSNGGILLTAFSANGEDWTSLEPGNIPASSSKMCAGRLASGEGYLILNSPSADRADTRAWLQILVTKPGEDLFSKQVMIRNSVSPASRSGGTQWSYPAAVEYGGSFYVAYSISKEDFGLSILPVTVLCDNA